MTILEVAREEDLVPGGVLRVVVGSMPITIFSVHGRALRDWRRLLA